MCDKCSGRGGRWHATECSREFRICESCWGEGSTWSTTEKQAMRKHAEHARECESAALALIREWKCQ